jgi:hypothetical protein
VSFHEFAEIVTKGPFLVLLQGFSFRQDFPFIPETAKGESSADGAWFLLTCCGCLPSMPGHDRVVF